MNIKSDAIKNCKLFQGCSPEEINLILADATQMSVKQGDPVFVINDPSQYVYVVLSGAIDIVGPGNVRNQYVRIRSVQAREHFAELSVLAAARHRSSAFASENSELICIPGPNYLGIIRQLPQVNLNQIEILSGHFSEMLRRTVFLPLLKDTSEVNFDRNFLKLPPLRLPPTRKAVPLRIESDVMTVGFCLPISESFIESVRINYPGFRIKFMLMEEDLFETIRKTYLNFYAGHTNLVPPLPPRQSLSNDILKSEIEDLRTSTLLLSQLPPEMFEALSLRFDVAECAKGDVIFSPANPSDRLYFLGSGQVELNKNVTSLNVQVAIANAEQYDVFFDTRLFDGEKQNITAIARSICRIFSISKSDFAEFLRQPEFAVPFAITFAQVISNLNRGAANFEFYPGQSPMVNLQAQPILSLSKIRELRIVPLVLDEKNLTVGTPLPRKELLDEAIDAYLRGFNIKMCLISEEKFTEWTADTPQKKFSEDTATIFSVSQNDTRLLKKVPKDSMAALDEILLEAIRSRVSDIHFEPNEKAVIVRYRIDGVITQLWDYIPLELGQSIMQRVKILSDMDIAESRRPQDGQFRFQKNQLESSFRTSTVPTRFGEKLVLRATSRKNSVIPLQLLAPNTKITKFFNRLTKYQQGIFFITGPTGSGKSTTLYSILNELNTRDKNIVTIEDPIEANLSGINQIEINPAINLTHEIILRNVLRQDPDVIMLGEIRDNVSMQLALDAALAGQLVLTTIHASNTFEVIPRIKELGGSTSHIASSLIGVMAQRLVRRLCECKGPRAISAKEMELFNGFDFSEPLTHIMEAKGCAKCNHSGFSGQIPIFEFWEKTMGVHHVLIDGGQSEALTAAIRGSNFESLTEYGLKMVAQGLTTMSEVNDVLFGIVDLMAS